MRTALVVQQHVPAGLNPAFAAANADGHSIPVVGEGEYLEVKAGDTAVDVTVVTPGSVSGLAIADRAINVPIGGTRKIPLSSKAYRQDDGTVHVNFSQVVNVTCGAFKP